MKDYAEPLLRGVPHGQKQYAVANRLLKFLDLFQGYSGGTGALHVSVEGISRQLLFPLLISDCY